MSISLEARAMAGEDYVNFGMKMEEWERVEAEETPDHLMAYYEDEEPPRFLSSISSNANNDGINCRPYDVNHVLEDNNEGKYEGCRRLRRLLIVIMAMCRLIMLLRVKHRC
ncbi:hypothetical protein vseg_015643 [Gypsophila vaccaria]